jgi:hypothetical protein
MVGLHYINQLGQKKIVREARDCIILQWGELFWNVDFQQRVDLTLEHPRVLVCGPVSVGKLTLINTHQQNPEARQLRCGLVLRWHPL